MSLVMTPFSKILLEPNKNGLTRPKRVRGAGIKMVNMGELFANSRIRNLPMERVPLSEREASFLLRNNDLLFARQSLVLSGAGKCIIFLGDSEAVTFESHIIRCRVDESKADPAFIYYYFNSSLGRQNIESIVEQGAGASGIRSSDLQNIVIPLPDLHIQKRAAYVLNLFDDKIECNNKTNENLEDIARALFRSWFVDFDPVRAKRDGKAPFGIDPKIANLFPDSFDMSEIGEIPSGWKLETIAEQFQVNPRYSLKKGERYPYTQMADLPIGGMSVPTFREREFTSGSRFSNGDTLIARITPCLENGKTAFVDYLQDGQTAWGSTEFIVLRSRDHLPLEASYLLARTENFRAHLIANMTGSSGRQRVPEDSLHRYLMPKPPREVGEAFGRVVRPLFELIRKNTVESQTLTESRDALLPRFLSGELSKEEAVCVAS